MSGTDMARLLLSTAACSRCSTSIVPSTVSARRLSSRGRGAIARPHLRVSPRTARAAMRRAPPSSSWFASGNAVRADASARLLGKTLSARRDGPLLGEQRSAVVRHEQVVHVVRVLLLLRENLLEEDARWSDR